MAIAAALNEMGYTAFVLFYRTKQDAVIAKAIEDMYACIRRSRRVPTNLKCRRVTT